MLWFGHTHAHKNCASDLWVEGIHTTSRDTRAASRPSHLPSHSDRAQTRKNTTSFILLQRGFTPTPARCWAASKVLGRRPRRRLSECPSCKRRLYVSRARHVSACLFYVSARGAIIAAATANSRRLSQQNPYRTCVSLVELGRTSRHFILHFKKIPTKIILRYGCCALLSSDLIRRDNVVRH